MSDRPKTLPQLRAEAQQAQQALEDAERQREGADQQDISNPEAMGIWKVDSVRIRVDKGRKGAGDQRVSVASPGGQFTPVYFAPIGVTVQRIYANEERIHPRESGEDGGDRLVMFLDRCMNQMNVLEACAKSGMKREPVIEWLEED